MPPETATPTLDEFIQTIKPLNPDASDAQLAQAYQDRFPSRTPDAPADAEPMKVPSLAEFTATLKPLNPDATSDELKTAWQERFPGAREEDLGFTGTLLEGLKGTGRSILAAGQTVIGDAPGAIETAQDSMKAPKDQDLERILASIDAKKNPDASWFDTGMAVGKSIVEHPRGAALLLTEQVPNSLAVLGTAGVGALAGSAFGPVGTIAGGIAGLFLGDIALETGAKAISAAADKTYTPEEQSQALKEGAIKGSVIGAVDTATLGLTSWLTSTVARAVERATVGVLTREGVDVADKAAILAARQNPTIAAAVKTAQEEARTATTTLGQRVFRGSGEVGLETIGEGAGEYIGELAATGQADKTEAIVEALAGFGQSAGEISAAQGWSRARRLAAEAVPPPDPIAAITGAKSTDEAIAATKTAIDAAPIDLSNIDAFIQGQEVETKTAAEAQAREAQRGTDQKALVGMLSYPDETGSSPVITDEQGNAFYKGSPIDVVTSEQLPDVSSPTEGMSKDQYEVLGAISGLFGKRIVLYEPYDTMPDGLVRQSTDPNTIFMSRKTSSADVFSTFAHEAIHLMEGTEFHSAFGMAVWEQLTPEAKQIAVDRHGDLEHDDLMSEIAADVGGTELHKPDVWEGVYRHLQDRVGDAQAKTEMLSFIDKIKGMITKAKELILSRPWSTGFGANKKTIAEQYIKDLTKVHDALAAGVANAIYETKDGKAEAGLIALTQKPAQSARAQKSVVVNVGLNVNDGSKLTPSEVLAAIASVGAKVQSHSVQESATEPTVIATLDRALTAKEAHRVSTALRQESIAQRVGDKGELYGPGAEKGKPFNPKYFLAPFDYDAIPEGHMVSLQGVREKTGESMTVKEEGKTALEDLDTSLSRYKALLECLSA